MKNKLKKVLALCLTILMLMPLIGVIPTFAEEVESTVVTKEGESFAVDKTYTVSRVLDKTPLTFEADISLPITYSGRPGVIFGNYSTNNIPAISFELETEQTVRIYANSGGSAYNIRFTYDVRSDTSTHIAVTLDPDTKTATLYINGEYVKSSTSSDVVTYSKIIPHNRYMVGGDLRTQSLNQQYFKGKINSVAVYSDTRTADEIKKAYTNGITSTDENLLVAYDLTKETIQEKIQDLSLNDNDLIYSNPEYDKAEMSNGLTFTSSDTYRLSNIFSVGSTPHTFEAELFLPTSTSSRGGVIVGNYSQNSWSVNLEIYETGQPRLYFENTNGTAYSFIFNEVDVRTGTWSHLAITLDEENGKITCYLDGTKKQELTQSDFTVDSNAIYDTALYLGRDCRDGSSGQYFKGSLKSVALYSDVRTDNEISADVVRVDTEDEALLAAYYFKEETGRNDISANNNNIYYDGEEIEQPDEGGDSEEGGTETTLAGLTFTSSDYAIIQKSLKGNAPYTFEATILIEDGYTGRAGVIVGNHYSNAYRYLSFEIHENGNPRLCLTSPTNAGDTGTFDYRFSNVSINTGEAVHLAITLEPTTGTASCYVNGELKQYITRKPVELIDDHFENYYLVLGNDPRNGGSQAFKGTIGNVSLYSDVRTADEIKADYEAISTSNQGIILHYDLSTATRGENITDLTGNGYNVKYQTRGFTECSSWINEKDAVSDYVYSFAVVGDTQIIAKNHADSFHMIYDWILANKTSKNIQYVFGLGDITDGNSTAEWTVAKENILRLNGEIPYSVVRGNHDGITQINNVFAYDTYYMNQFIGFYAENDMTSSYRTLTVEDTNYLLITLDYGASDSVLDWAGGIIEKYPSHKVIITTHAYLYRDGTTLDSGDVCPPSTSGGYNNGDHMWEKLISKYENIYLVMSGHDPSAEVVVTQTEGVNGNIVTQILSDHQGVDTATPTGMVTMLYFKADGSIEVETYSTIQEKYYKEANQFVIEETEHQFTENAVYSYENGYLQPGTATANCVHCSKQGTKEVAPIIVFKGYSIKDDNTAICVDYSINYEAMKQAGINLMLGVVSCASDNLVNKDNKPINADGTTAEVTAGKVVSSIIENEHTNVAVIMKTSDWSKYADKGVILCMYMLENETVSYVCDRDAVSDSALAVTYNEILNGGSVQ